MFRKNKPETQVQVSPDRVKAVLAKKATPTDYADSTRGQRAPRTTVFKQALATLPHGEKVPVVIKDMSATGVRVEFFQNRPLGDRVLITEASVPLRFWADVVWEDDGAVGLRNATPSEDKD